MANQDSTENGFDAAASSSQELDYLRLAYGRQLGNLDGMVEAAKRLDASGATGPSPVQNLGSVYFGKVLLHGAALQKIVPRGTSEYHDLGSVAALTRAIAETYLSFRYFCVDPKSEEEFKFLGVFAEYHHTLKTSQAVGDAVGAEEIANLRAALQERRDALLANAIFLQQNEREREAQLDGKKMPHRPLSEIAQQAGIHPKNWRMMYTSLSQYAHSTPTAIFRLRDGGNSKPQTLVELVVFVGVAYSLMAMSALDLLELYKGKKAAPDADLNCILFGVHQMRNSNSLFSA
jgi:hypothetical protein